MSDKPKDDSTPPSEPAKKPKAPAPPVKKEAVDPDKKPATVRKAPAAPSNGNGNGVTAEPKAKAAPETKTKTPADKTKAPADKTRTTAEPKPKSRKSEGVTKEPKEKPKAVKEVKKLPKPSQGVWGIDLGLCALKAIRLEVLEGKIVATAFDYIEHPKILSQPDADPDQLTKEALEKFLSRNSLSKDLICISVPGQSGLARFVKLPPVEEKKITDIVKFEAKQQIPFNLDEVVWDYQKIGSGAVTDGFAMDTEIGLFAIKRDLVNRALQHFLELGVDVHYVQMAPLALCNFAAFDLLGKGGIGAEDQQEEESDEKKCVVALDIGADGSNLVITDGERIIWQRSIPLGGNHFTRALTKDLKLTFAKAEHLKKNATKSPDLKKILASLKPVLNDFVSEVQCGSLGYFTNTHRNAELEYIIGLGNAFRLPGFQRYLEEKLQITVKKLGKMERMTGDKVIHEQAFTDNVMSFAVAYGLAVQGLEKSRLTTNLLPSDVRVQRLVKAKKPWVAASAAMLLIGLSGLVFGYGLDYRAVGSKPVTDARKLAAGVVAAATKNQKTFDQSVQAAKNEENNVASMLAGQPERRHFLELLKFIGETVPRSDGTNVFRDPLTGKILDDEKRKNYWTQKPDPESMSKTKFSGKDAYKKLGDLQTDAKTEPADTKQKPERGGAELLDPPLPPFFGDIIQVNIEAMDCRYCDDLDTFWDYLRNNVIKDNTGDVHPFALTKVPFAKNKDVKEGGWVVELRGYTFHYQGRRFLNDVFAENIARLGMPDFDPSKPEKELPDKGAIRNRISHVVLLPAPEYGAVNQKTDSTRKFEKLNVNYVDNLIRSAVEKKAHDRPAAAPNQPGVPQQPIAPGTPPPPPPPPNPDLLREKWMSIGGSPSGGPHRGDGPVRIEERGETPPKGEQSRTEFVILFIWREPTPSDQLRGLAEPVKTPAPVQPGVPARRQGPR